MCIQGILTSITFLMVTSSSTTVPEAAKMTDKDPKVLLNDIEGKTPEITQLKNLKTQINLIFLPAFQNLYFKRIEEVKFSTSKKMFKIKRRLRKARTHRAARKVILTFLHKYQIHLNDLKKFVPETNVVVLENIQSNRLYVLEMLENQLKLVVREVLESIEVEEKQLYNVTKRNKGTSKPLLRFRDNGDFSYMTNCDIYYLNHLREFLDYCIDELNKKRIEDRRNRII